jgi:hypothetical protein
MPFRSIHYVSAFAIVFPIVACSSGDATTTASGDGGAPNPDASPADASSSPDSATPDASPDVVADVAPDVPKAWSPSDLGTSLVVWLDANKGITADTFDIISAWADQSSAHNDASPVPALAPKRVMNAVNGLPAIQFEGQFGTSLQIADSATLQWGTGDFAVFEVISYTNPASGDNSTGYGLLWGKLDNGGNGLALFGNDGAAGNGAIRAQLQQGVYASSPGTSYNDGRWHYVAAIRTAPALYVRADGSSASWGNAPQDIGNVGSNVLIGARPSMTQMLKGEIAEIVAVKGTLASGDLTKMEAYLKGKYGL